MSDDKKLKEAKIVYKTLCEMLDEKKLKYKKIDDQLHVNMTMYGDDLPMRIGIDIDQNNSSICYHTALPVLVPKDKCLDVAIAISQINYGLANGSIMFELITGLVIFKVTSCYMDCLVSKAMLEHLLAVLCLIADEYNDKLLMLVKGELSLKNFLSELMK